MRALFSEWSPEVLLEQALNLFADCRRLRRELDDTQGIIR